MKLRLFVIGAVLAGLAQSAALGKIIFDRANLLKNGTEVVLRSGMVDPRDLFRGHYVVLNLEISSINAKDVILDKSFTDAFGKEADTGQLRGKPVYVSLKKGDDQFWVPDALYGALPVGIDQPFIRGEYRAGSRITVPGPDDNQPAAQGTHMIQFPINRFFAERDRAKDLEKVRQGRNLGIVVALSDSGEAAIKGISVEGELIYNEPVF